jgi:phage major head subunit gpT-like protein
MLVRGQFSDFYLDTMKPALKALIWNEYNQRPAQWSQIFDVQTSNRSIEQTSQLSGVGLFRSITEGGAVTYDSPVQGFDKTYIHTRSGLGIKVSQDVVEDDKIGLVAKAHRELARSCQETLEIAVAAHFNTGTAVTGFDGVSLFNANHPLTKVGGVQNNIAAAAADLDVVSLQLALTDCRGMVDSSGKKIRVPWKKLIVAPANEYQAYEIVKSPMRPDTANNAANALKYGESGMPTVFVWDYLTDPDTWFLVANPSDTRLLFFWRRKPYTKSWYEDETETGITAMRYKCSHGWSDFYGTYMVPGAG